MLKLRFVGFAFALSVYSSWCVVAQERQPMVAPDDAPSYSLSNIRTESGRFFGEELVIDYKRTRAGYGSVQIAGKTANGPLQVFGFPIDNKESGTLRLENRFSMGRGLPSNIEIYLIVSAYWVGKQYGACMVSNAVRLGNPGDVTTPRQWTGDERAAYEKNKLFKIPPTGLPNGFEAVAGGTTLVPGMPIKAGWYGDWLDAQVVQLNSDDTVAVKYDAMPSVIQRPRAQWLAVDPDVAQRANANPSEFSTSIRILAGGSIPLPDDAVALEPSLKLLVGTPLMIEQGTQWQTVYVVNAEPTKIKVRVKGQKPVFDRDHALAKFAIKNETLAVMTKPESVAEYAANVAYAEGTSGSAFPSKDTPTGGFARPASKPVKNYTVSIAVPKGALFVPADLRIEAGTPLAGCWASKWNPITAISENDDGTLNVHWDAYSDAWDCCMSRQQLIIEEKTVRRLRAKSGATAEDLTKTLRTWSDTSGQHKVEARFVRKTATDVTIKTDAGREITMAIAKLSSEDQELLAGIQAVVENPFE